jgi:signal transduction histidine kinase
LANLQMDFVASVSHELRTPLAVVLSAGQNITDGVVPDLKVYGSIITNQTRQLIDLVDQILTFVSMKKDRGNYVLRPFDPTELLEQVQKNTVAFFEQTGFALKFTKEESLPLVMGDMRLLSRCLQNLIGNAAKYAGRSRSISVSAHCEETEGFGKGVRISVQDWGIGIAPSDLPLIFDPFYRSPQVVAAQIHGTLGVGSTFNLHLPIVEESDRESLAVGENRVSVR